MASRVDAAIVAVFIVAGGNLLLGVINLSGTSWPKGFSAPQGLIVGAVLGVLAVLAARRQRWALVVATVAFTLDALISLAWLVYEGNQLFGFADAKAAFSTMVTLAVKVIFFLIPMWRGVLAIKSVTQMDRYASAGLDPPRFR